ncbi:MAG: fumarate hydratase class II [Porticoccaceae bacterium]|nr:MAG: fumarate hydratase class II [Porticoccaceae bacterium]
MNWREERDSLGVVRVPADALWRAQTQRAVENFPLSGERMPEPFLRALALIKQAAARVNGRRGLLDPERAEAIARAAEAVAAGHHLDQFPVDVFQTGSGTSSNMNANEVIATLAERHLGGRLHVHPNDHVNLCQSSNDVVPTAIQLAAALELRDRLEPARQRLVETVAARAEALADVVKTGRTHLMDAMPLTFGQELSAWVAQLEAAGARLAEAARRLHALPIGGTAVGTGVNSFPGFGAEVAAELASLTGLPLSAHPCPFFGIASVDAPLEFSAQLRGLAVAMLKICNDLRWMNSGPLAGLAEIELPALQPGSSIMPGKVNPVIPEAVAMACVQVLGFDAALAVAGQSSNFQLNVMLPLVARNLLQGVTLLANGARLLANKAVSGFRVNRERIEATLAQNPILATALNPLIGYERAAEIARRAFAERRPVLEIALEETDLPREVLERLLDPRRLTQPNLEPGQSAGGGS